jgi:hypothetical protein
VILYWIKVDKLYTQYIQEELHDWKYRDLENKYNSDNHSAQKDRQGTRILNNRAVLNINRL